MRDKRNKKGFTMIELMMAVAIIGIIAGVAFISVVNYLRSMKQLELDGIAKEMFVAAQNHLTMAEGQGYLKDGDDKREDGSELGDDYYFVYPGADYGNSVLGYMLPFGSIDETVRAGGSYVIRYSKDPAIVMDVFYCDPHDPRYAHTFLDGEVSSLMSDFTGPGKKGNRRQYNNGASVIGWFGGEEAEKLDTITLENPSIEVVNAEKLYVKIINPNFELDDEASLKLVIKGLSSGAEASIELDNSESSMEYVLDDITVPELHFVNNFAADTTDKTVNGTFIPGENITVEAISYCNEYLSNIAGSGTSKTNSLFAELGGVVSEDDLEISAAEGTIAKISNIRHLENLSEQISQVSSTNVNALYINRALQTRNLDWNSFKDAEVFESDNVVVTDRNTDSATKNGGPYLPIDRENVIYYDGGNHSISGISVDDYEGNAGLFGTISAIISEIKNLELIDFSIHAKGTSNNAGALAGQTVAETTITNVLVRNTTPAADINIQAEAGAAGGLVGSVAAKGTIQECAAAVIVQGSTNAGGLIGVVTGSGVTVKWSYSGGHTKQNTGMYDDSSYNITAVAETGVSGGLIGDSGAAKISECYSTCSAKGNTVGSLTGRSSGNISNCYATGLVACTEGGTEGALIGSSTGTIAGCLYYEIINYRPDDDPDADHNAYYPYLAPVGNGDKTTRYADSVISMIDGSADKYNAFVQVGDSSLDASPYDLFLLEHFKGKYYLKGISQLDTGYSTNINKTDDSFVLVHYGDWPAPETLVINQSS